MDLIELNVRLSKMYLEQGKVDLCKFALRNIEILKTKHATQQSNLLLDKKGMESNKS